MSLIEALILGLVQGLSEFLPVSSSGHLTLVPFVFGWKEPTFAFVVAVHLGTLVGVTSVFREQVASLLRTALSWGSAEEEDRRRLRLIAIATVPAVIVGLVFEGVVGDAFQRPVLVSLLLGLTGYLLMSSETVSERSEATARGDEDVAAADATAIGIAQAVAVLPGISRSGATISVGMRAGLSRGAAARFSFLLSIPVILGAGLVKVPDMLRESTDGAGAFVVGVVTAGVSGYVAVRWFLGVVQRRGLRGFGVYCFCAMTAGLLTALARG